MISSVSNSTPAKDQTQSAAAQSPTVYETPFGDVLASQITGINLDAWVTGGNSTVASMASAARNEAALSTTGTVKPTYTASTSAAAATASTDTNSSSTVATTTTSTTTASPSDVPTLESVFGTGDVWQNDPGGSGDGVSWNYNPIYFATEQTAETVAQMLGGQVVAENDITSAAGSPLQQSQPNEMVQLSSGAQVNAGLVADLFNHGYSQGYIDQELTGIEQQGVSAS
ncbi:MAG: hypothetical protein ACLQVN_01590 [Bryobacteraceae bacterium]